jgi:hypothetical protein
MAGAGGIGAGAGASSTLAADFKDQVAKGIT